jgi:uncharacterized protein
MMEQKTAMNTVVQDKMSEVAEVCKRRRVRHLALFGSAARGLFDSASSDLDFVVEFEQLTPAERADCYFGLLEDLERLFKRRIDLVEPEPIQNPYFRQAIEETQVLVYAAA